MSSSTKSRRAAEAAAAEAAAAEAERLRQEQEEIDNAALEEAIAAKAKLSAAAGVASIPDADVESSESSFSAPASCSNA